MTVTSSKVRIYDLAKELKLDTKRLIEEVRREGVDVSVPSNSVSKELAEKIRNKYYPKKETAVKRTVKVVKRAALPTPEAPVGEAEPEFHETEPVVDAASPTLPSDIVEMPAPAAPAPPKPAAPTKLVKRLTPAARAEAPAAEVIEEPPPNEIEPEAEPFFEIQEPVTTTVEPPAAAPTAPSNGAEVKPQPAPAPVVPSRQVRVLRPTAAALNAGIRPGERAPVPTPPPAAPPRERTPERPAERSDRPARLRDRPSLPRSERMGTPGETATPQTDRKSTRLNSSHLVISYAVFCLKKKRR